MARGAAVAATLATARGPLPARGVAATAAVISPGGVAWDDDGTIVFVGPADDLPWEPVSLGRVDEGTIVPGFVDCHVHLPFVGWRADEFEARLAGVSYRDIHGKEGGIFRSARMLAEADDEEVLAFSKALAVEMAAHGTTAMELKSGYGLSVEGELRQLRLARRLAEAVPQTCAVTLLACHAIPDGWSREDWVARRVRRADPRGRGGGARRTPSTSTSRTSRSPLDDLERVGGGGLGRRAAAPGARRPARAERGGRGRRRAGSAERRPSEPRRAPTGIAALGEGRDRGGPAPVARPSPSGRRRRPSLRSGTPAPPSRSRPT